MENEAEDIRDQRDELRRDNEKLYKKLDECERTKHQLLLEQEQFHKKILDHNNRLIKMQEQLGEREEVIKTKEKTVKELRNINSHLENFRFVIDHKIRSLKDEKIPMEQQIKNLEQHIKQMYQELLEESDKKKDLMKKLDESEQRLKVTKDQMKKKSDEVVFSRRKLDLIQYDLNNLLKNTRHQEWPLKLRDIYATHFDTKGDDKNTSDPHPSGPASGAADGEGQDNESSNVKDELIRQRNWMNNKLKSISEKNKKLEKEKNDIYLKIQKENTELIKECNMLRDDNHKISRKVLVLEKKLKDISGISLSNSNLIDAQIENFLKKASSLTTKHKDTPFMARKKNMGGAGTGNNARYQMLLDYYNQFAVPGEGG
jgi:chromosome segregation ATPase